MSIKSICTERKAELQGRESISDKNDVPGGLLEGG